MYARARSAGTPNKVRELLQVDFGTTNDYCIESLERFEIASRVLKNETLQ
jgi:hypothetical protein